MILNARNEFKHSPAVSIYVSTENQEETDSLWTSLIANGGKESMCGWLEDRYGISWQIIPRRLIQLLNDPDREAVDRVHNKMLEMSKIDILVLEDAFRLKN